MATKPAPSNNPKANARKKEAKRVQSFISKTLGPLHFANSQQASDELARMEEILRSDLDICRRNLKSDFEKRQYVRAAFAMIEGVVYAMKNLIVNNSNSYPPDLFTSDELEKLTECRVVGTDAKGLPKTEPKYVNLKENVIFAGNAYLRASGSATIIDKSGSDWPAFGNAIKVRDRVVHPKTVGSLTITDRELGQVGDAIRWFEQIVSRVLLDSVKPIVPKWKQLVRGLRRRERTLELAVAANLRDKNLQKELRTTKMLRTTLQKHLPKVAKSIKKLP